MTNHRIEYGKASMDIDINIRVIPSGPWDKKPGLCVNMISEMERSIVRFAKAKLELFMEKWEKDE